MILSLTRSAMRSIETRLVHLVRNFGDDDRLAVFGEGFDGGLGAHDEAATAGFVGLENSARGRE